MTQCNKRLQVKLFGETDTLHDTTPSDATAMNAYVMDIKRRRSRIEHAQKAALIEEQVIA